MNVFPNDMETSQNTCAQNTCSKTGELLETFNELSLNSNQEAEIGSKSDKSDIVTKGDIRMKTWNLMEKKNFVKDYPRPCHHKIPHFKRCGIAAEKLSRLREFVNAKCIKINPSMAQMHLRYLTLTHGKTLLVPSPALSEDFMYEINPKLLKHSWQKKTCFQ